MLLQLPPVTPSSAHVIVFGNEKGGSGKSTLAMHIGVALLKAGQRVASIDLDSRQKSLTRQIENRKAWAKRLNGALEVPTHFCVARAEGARVDDNETAEFSRFAEIVSQVEHSHDFIIIDTPATDSYLMRLAHAMADTLVTPVNDSFVDFDVLGSVDPVTFAVTDVSHYAQMTRESRHHRRIVDGKDTDWIVVRNRLSLRSSRNSRLMNEGLRELGLRMGYRSVDGLGERVVYREFFPRGVTALDNLDQATLGVRPNLSHINARHEVRALLGALKLPLDERGRRRAAARAEWTASRDRPVELHNILAD